MKRVQAVKDIVRDVLRDIFRALFMDRIRALFSDSLDYKGQHQGLS